MHLAMHTSKLRVPIYYQFGNHKVPTTCHQNQQQTWKRNSCVSEWCRANVKSHAGKKTCRKPIQQQISLKILKLALKTVGNSSQGYNIIIINLSSRVLGGHTGYNPCTSHPLLFQAVSLIPSTHFPVHLFTFGRIFHKRNFGWIR